MARLLRSAAFAGVAVLIAAGCGGEESASTSTATTSELAKPDEIYNACLEQLADTSVTPSAAQTTCSQARALFAQCTIEANGLGAQARRDEALAKCQHQADKALAGLADAVPE